MKKNITLLCAVILISQAITYGQKTEVIVQKGKVVAQTAAGNATIDAGRKAVLEQNGKPIVTVDDPMVDDIMKIYQWVEAEREANEIKIDFTSIQVNRIESESSLIGAWLAEIPNMKSEPGNITRIGLTSILNDPKYYDLDGNLLKYDLDKFNEKQGYYYLHYPKPVAPGDNFKFICVSEHPVTNNQLRQQGNLWILRLGNCTANCLNYFRVILPQSAIFVESSRPLTSVDSFNGRVAVTIRNYTGPNADGMYQISFLWPQKNGTTLADIPPRYRGIPEQPAEQAITKSVKSPEETLLDILPWDKAGPEALKVYQEFVEKKIEYTSLWFELGIKLVGGGYWDEAFDCFNRCESLHSNKESPTYLAAVIWQGHIYDIKDQRQKALEKYNDALKVIEQYKKYASQKNIDIEKMIFMEHSQWNITISVNWIKERLEKPFTKEMFGK